MLWATGVCTLGAGGGSVGRAGSVSGGGATRGGSAGEGIGGAVASTFGLMPPWEVAPPGEGVGVMLLRREA